MDYYNIHKYHKIPHTVISEYEEAADYNQVPCMHIAGPSQFDWKSTPFVDIPEEKRGIYDCVERFIWIKK